MPDVVVVGGGIIGAACAYYLSGAGASVRVLERRWVANGTSRACDGLILVSDKPSPAESILAQTSAHLWAELADTLDQDFEYVRSGAIVLAETAEELAEAGRKAARLQQSGIRAEVLHAAGLHALEPNLAPDLAGGIYYPDEAQVDARLATVALLQAARRQGAVLQEGVEVTGLRQAADGRVVAVTTQAGDVAGDVIVLAAGVWSEQIAATIGLALPVRPRKGHILVTGRVPGLIRHPLLEGSYSASVHTAAEETQVALVAEMTAGGTLLLGSSREFAGFDRSVSEAIIRAIAARAVRFLPALARTSVIRSYAGLRPWTPDHLPLIGPAGLGPAGGPADLPTGLFLATGHEGAGIGLAPVTGQIVADWIMSGQMPALAESVRPGRFLEN